MSTVGITALVPPEIVYATGNVPIDINNYVPKSKIAPRDKLCAWTAIWRDLALRGKITLDKLVVVAGGDCNNATVDGEKLELSGIDTHYFTYPFDGSTKLMKEEVLKLVNFLGNSYEKKIFKDVDALKKTARDVDALRVKGRIGSEEGFNIEISGSDLAGVLELFRRKMEDLPSRKIDYEYRVALLGTPPIYTDFHRFLDSIGLHVVYDEMPYEFIRLGGVSIDALAKNYAEYTFARNISLRIKMIEQELKKRRVDAVIHFHQFACHHKLEDPILRDSLNRTRGYPYISIEADLPSKTPQQTRLRLEAFKERLGDYS
jgi:benzoyl-CoA reductase/2-hydroxyglutaryl-CoA dehydratase subunit BcrC/BadD/HgdB